MPVSLYSDINVDAIHFANPTKNSKGSTQINVQLNETSDAKVKFQLVAEGEGRCQIVFGIKTFDDTETNRKNLDFSMHSTGAIEFIQRLDEHIIKTATERSESWFRKKLSEADIRALYKPIIAFDTSGKGYSPLVHSKVNIGAEEKNALKVTKDVCVKGKHYYAPGTDALIDAKNNRFRDFTAVPIMSLGAIWTQPR